MTMAGKLEGICNDAIRALNSGKGQCLTFPNVIKEIALNMRHVALHAAADLDLDRNRLSSKRKWIAKETPTGPLRIAPPKDNIAAPTKEITLSRDTVVSILTIDDVIRLMQWPKDSLLLLLNGFDFNEMVLTFKCSKHKELLKYYRQPTTKAGTHEKGIKTLAATIKRYENKGWKCSLSLCEADHHEEDQICLVWESFHNYVHNTADAATYDDETFNNKRSKLLNSQYESGDDGDRGTTQDEQKHVEDAVGSNEHNEETSKEGAVDDSTSPALNGDADNGGSGNGESRNEGEESC